MRRKRINVFIRHTVKTIFHPFSRFIALLAIVAIGCGCLAGLLAAAPDMRSSIDTYYDERNFMDITMLSTLGFSEADISAISELDCIEQVRGGYREDVMLSHNGNLAATRITSLGDGSINECRPESGRMPENSGECVVVLEEAWASTMQMGDTLVFNEENEHFYPHEFKVVGFISAPEYISVEKETTNIGSGSIELMIFVQDSDFNSEAYTIAYATISGAKPLNAFTDEYTDLIDNAENDLEELSTTQKPARLEEIRSDAQSELNDAKKEYNDAKEEANAELSDAKQKLDDAKAELKDGEKQLDSARKKISDGEAELASAKEQYNSQISAAEKEISNGEKEINSAQSEIDSSRKQLTDSQKELDSAKAELEKQKSALAESGKQIEEAQIQFDKSAEQLSDTKKQLDSAKEALDEQYSQLEEAKLSIDKMQSEIDSLLEQGMYDEAAELQTQLEALNSTYNDNKELYDQAAAQYSASEDKYNLGLEKYNTELEAFNEKKNRYEAGVSALEQAEKELESSQAQLDAGFEQLEIVQKELDTQREALSAGKSELENQKKTGLQQLEEAAEELAAGREKIFQSQTELENGWAEYNDGVKDYNEGRAEADSELADAQKKIDDAQKEIDDLEEPEWYIRTRNSNIGYTSLDTNAENMAGIAKVFPVFFFLVAALVALTSMTRMVDEDRTLIGTFKALGYSNAVIKSKYISYAALATLIGSVTGSILGFKLLPTVIWNAFSLMYTVTYFEAPVRMGYLIAVTAVALAVVLLTTLYAINSGLKEVPASLMRPKAPKPNKRILLEKMTLIWRRLKFSHKVTARNIFRYKKRMFMTLFGIMGCTALLLIGFGLKNSIDGIVTKQYNDVIEYNYTVVLEDAEITPDMAELLSDKSCFSMSASAMQKSVNTLVGEKEILSYTIAFPEDSDFEGLINLQERKSGKELTIQPGSVIISEKLSMLTGAKAGDNITVELDDKKYTLPVSGVTENYVYHYIYMDFETYEQIYSEPAEINVVFARSAEGAGDLSSKLLETDGVSALNNTDTLQANFSASMDKLNAVVYVLVLMAAGLAFIVLYNLTNINIEERKREIATIKMLGFFDGEVGMYIFREIIILSFLGALIGLVFGRGLFEFVISTAEIEITMFSRDILPMSYVYSAALTMVFTIIVCFVMFFRLKKISMVESLGSGE